MTLPAMPPAMRVTDATSTKRRPSKSRGSGSCAASAATPAAARWMALSASHGRAEWPARPWKIQVALMFPRQPACSALSVGSIITTSSGWTGWRASSGVRALSVSGSSSRPKKSAPNGAPSRISSIITASAPFMSLAPRPCTRSASRRPGRLPWAGTVSRWPPSSTRAPSRPASTAVSPRSRAPGSRPRRCSARAASSRDSEGMSMSSSVLAARRSPSSLSLGGMRRHHTPMRFCGIDVSARADNQQLCTLHERRGSAGVELVATFYAPGTVAALARTIQGFGRGEAVVGIDAPSGRRLGLLGEGSPARAALGLPDGRYERMRVCDAVLYRRGLPLYPVPAAEEGAPDWMLVGFELFEALAPLGRYVPEAVNGTLVGDVGNGAIRSGRVFETYPDAIFCALLGHRPPPKRTPWGGQQRIAALKLKGIVDDDGGLWHRTLDEIDACAAAYAAYALCVGLGTWVGDPAEGVMVIPTARLLDRYAKLPAPARSALA